MGDPVGAPTTAWSAPGLGVRRSETIERALVRVVGEQLNVVTAALEAEPEDLGRAVHVARRTLKKVRALLKLVVPDEGVSALTSPVLELRDAGRAISSLRDADVLVQTAAAVAKRLSSDAELEAFAPLEDLVREEYEARSTEGDRAGLATAANHVATARASIDVWTPEQEGFTLISDRLGAWYCRAKKAMVKACGEASAKAFHSWRKRSKDVRHQLEFLAPVAPELKVAAKDFHRLTDVLGEANDLLQLEIAARRLGSDGLASPGGVLESIAEMQRSQWSEACDLGRTLYSRRPADHVAELAGHWQRWITEERAEPGPAQG